MPEALTDPRLLELDREVEQVKDDFDEALQSLPQAFDEVSNRPAVDPSIQRRLIALSDRLKALKPTIEDLDFDLEQANVLMSAILDIDRAVNGEMPDLDRFETMLLGIERIRQVIRDSLDEFGGGPRGDRAALIRGIERALPGVRQGELARLLGVDPRTVRRWASSQGEPDDRLVLIARLVATLRHAWTPAGVLAWFERPREALDGRAPIELIADPARQRELISEARASRNQYGT
jgi:transcriptional regulator with XRE-family HTH domain